MSPEPGKTSLVQQLRELGPDEFIFTAEPSMPPPARGIVRPNQELLKRIESAMGGKLPRILTVGRNASGSGITIVSRSQLF